MSRPARTLPYAPGRSESLFDSQETSARPARQGNGDSSSAQQSRKANGLMRTAGVALPDTEDGVLSHAGAGSQQAPAVAAAPAQQSNDAGDSRTALIASMVSELSQLVNGALFDDSTLALLHSTVGDALATVKLRTGPLRARLTYRDVARNKWDEDRPRDVTLEFQGGRVPLIHFKDNQAIVLTVPADVGMRAHPSSTSVKRVQLNVYEKEDYGLSLAPNVKRGNEYWSFMLEFENQAGRDAFVERVMTLRVLADTRAADR